MEYMADDQTQDTNLYVRTSIRNRHHQSLNRFPTTSLKEILNLLQIILVLRTYYNKYFDSFVLEMPTNSKHKYGGEKCYNMGDQVRTLCAKHTSPERMC